eukprot:11211855-Lingulodinium_polyedra.AAC.1
MVAVVPLICGMNFVAIVRATVVGWITRARLNFVLIIALVMTMPLQTRSPRLCHLLQITRCKPIYGLTHPLFLIHPPGDPTAWANASETEQKLA